MESVENDISMDSTQAGRRIGLTDDRRNAYNCSPSQNNGQFASIFPCDYPTNPQYHDLHERLKTFASWPYEHLSPELLAAAGLFYLGDRDRCKCFYCNGGLQNWEHGDDPMAEHAKYFPQCEFVLQQKGPDYVADLNSNHPNLRRPGVADTSAPISQPFSSTDQSVQNNLSMQQSSPVPMDVPPQDARETSTALRINAHEYVEEAKQFGFSEDTIKRLIDRKLLQNNETPYASLFELITDLIQFEEEERKSGNIVHHEPQITPNCQVRSGSGIADSCPQVAIGPSIQTAFRHEEAAEALAYRPREVRADSNMKSQLQSALDESICKACYTRERSCAFMNCGHLCCCFECGQKMKRCPICNSKIEQAIRIYKI